MADKPRPSNREFAKLLRRGMTVTERFVWNQLRDRRIGYHFRRQHPVGGYVLDFYCSRSQLCVEIDGVQHVTTDLEKDNQRDEDLRQLGVMTIRFRNEEIVYDWPNCLEKILFVCIERDSVTG